MQVFLFASFKVPTESMESAILPGDFVLVNKLIVGPRIYNNLGIQKGKIMPYKRINGFSTIRRNDILVFDAPYLFAGMLKSHLNTFYVKRCIAVPCDTLYIENGIYQIKCCTEPLGNYQNQLLLSQTADETFEKHVFDCFPNDTTNRWNIKNFGPFYIPGKGERIELTPRNISLYSPLIEYETGKRITAKEGRIYLGGEMLQSYNFMQNYYFMAGDNVIASYDSRYWGLLPEDLVVGKAVMIWKIVGMENQSEVKRIPYGHTNFEKIRMGNYLYVDKTRFIEQLENESTDFHFLIRPRKFGKSLFVSVLDHYYDVRHTSNFDQLFGDLYIGKHPTPKRNDLFVLNLDFSGIDTSSIQRFNVSLLEMLKMAFISYITAHRAFVNNMDEAKEKVWTMDTTRACLEYAFDIADSNNKKSFVIIDEYDHFANDMIASGTYLGNENYPPMGG